jgi:hypothetical protein
LTVNEHLRISDTSPLRDSTGKVTHESVHAALQEFLDAADAYEGRPYVAADSRQARKVLGDVTKILGDPDARLSRRTRHIFAEVAESFGRLLVDRCDFDCDHCRDDD